MPKRKAEQQMVTGVHHCKRRAWEIPPSLPLSTPKSEHLPQRGKRKLEPAPDSALEELLSPACNRAAHEEEEDEAVTPEPCKRQRVQEPEPSKESQDENNFSEFNSFQYWRIPLPKIDLTEILDTTCENNNKRTAELSEEMEN